MTEEEYAKHKQYAGEAKPSMNRRRVGHDYSQRRLYFITMTIEGRRPLLGHLVGETGATPESAVARIELSPLGQRVKEEWFAVTAHHPEVTAVSLQLMPDHLHGILFVEHQMEQHLGAIISGFKASTNKAYRQLVLGNEAAAAPQHSQQAAAAPAASFALSGASASFALSGAPASSALGGAPASSALSGAPASSALSGAPASSALSGAPAPSALSGAPASSTHGGAPASSTHGGAPVPPVGCAAALPQRKERRDRSRESREHGLLWAPNYNDHILSNQGELDRWRQYLADNPRRLFLRRQFPDLFRVSFGLRIGPYTCSAVGNRFLLSFPKIKQVQCSTHFYEEDIQKAVAGYMAAARGGAVLVSPSISEGEKRTMRAAFDASLPMILITANGLGSYSKPGGAYFDACAEGWLLILSPWEHQNHKVTLTRAMCLEMNALAKLIAEGSDDSGGATAQPTAGKAPTTATENNKTSTI